METKNVTVVATDGTPITLAVPTTIPTEERAEYLRALFGGKVAECLMYFPGAERGEWRGPVYAVCPSTLVEDVKEALEFMGALVDRVLSLPDGRVTVMSDGYWAHGF